MTIAVVVFCNSDRVCYERLGVVVIAVPSSELRHCEAHHVSQVWTNMAMPVNKYLIKG